MKVKTLQVIFKFFQFHFLLWNYLLLYILIWFKIQMCQKD